MVLSEEQLIKKSSYFDKDSFSIVPECAFIDLFFPFTVFFQIRIYLSSPQEYTLVESELNNTSLTGPLWPINLNGRIWGLKLQTKTNPSAPPDTTCFMSLEKSTAFTVF